MNWEIFNDCVNRIWDYNRIKKHLLNTYTKDIDWSYYIDPVIKQLDKDKFEQKQMMEKNINEALETKYTNEEFKLIMYCKYFYDHIDLMLVREDQMNYQYLFISKFENLCLKENNGKYGIDDIKLFDKLFDLLKSVCVIKTYYGCLNENKENKLNEIFPKGCLIATPGQYYIVQSHNNANNVMHGYKLTKINQPIGEFYDECVYLKIQNNQKLCRIDVSKNKWIYHIDHCCDKYFYYKIAKRLKTNYANE